MLPKLYAVSLAIVSAISMSAECRAEELPKSFPDDVPIAEYMEVTNVILGEWYQTELGRQLGVDDTLMVEMTAIDKPIDDVAVWFRDGLTDADWWLIEERAHRSVVTMLFQKDERMAIVQVAEIVDVPPGRAKCRDLEEIRVSPNKRVMLELTSVESHARRGVPQGGGICTLWGCGYR